MRAFTIIFRAVCMLVAPVSSCNLVAHVSPSPLYGTTRSQLRQRLRADWAYDGARILGHLGDDVCLWDAKSGVLLRRMSGHKERIRFVDLSLDGTWALSCSYAPRGEIDYQSKDTSCRIWDLRSGTSVHVLPGQRQASVSPDGTRVLSFEEASVRNHEFLANVWDRVSGRKVSSVRLNRDSDDITLHFVGNGDRFVCTPLNPVVVYDSDTCAILQHVNYLRKKRGASLFRFDQSGTHMVTADGEALSVWNLRTGSLERTIKIGAEPSINEFTLPDVALSRDGSMVVCSRGRKVGIWNLATGKEIGSFKSPSPIEAIFLNAPGNRCVLEMGAYPHAITIVGYLLLDTQTGKVITTIKPAGEWDRFLAFDPSGKTLLVGGTEFVIYNSGTGEVLRSFDLLKSQAQPMSTWSQVLWP